MSGVVATREGRVLRLTLDAPPGNILGSAMIRELGRALDEGLRPELLAVVLEGAGDHFSFGASVEEHARVPVRAMLPLFHGLIRRVAGLGVPTISVVRGQCLGGGLELALVTTWIIASPSARFGQPEAKLGVFAPIASLALPWRIGGGRALDLCVSGRTIDAAEAKELGLVREVAEDPLAAARDLIARDLSRKSASSLRFVERAAREDLIATLDRSLPRLERVYLEELMETADANEGIGAFLEKRSPRYAEGG